MITISIIEDDIDICYGLKYLLQNTSDYECLGTYHSCEEALEDLAENPPDVILLDIKLPGMSGIEGINKIKQILPNVEIIMLTVFEDDKKVFDSISAGASGYLVKTAQPAQIVDAIREIIHGGAPLSTTVARKIVDSFHKPSTIPLTCREREILSLLCQGKSYKMIADSLYISQGTVHSHIKNLYKKLNVNSKSEAVAKAFQLKIV